MDSLPQMDDTRWRVERGHRWVVVNADCLDVLPMLEAESVDAVVTDPPYGMHKAAWDMSIVPVDQWLPIARALAPVAVFTGVKGAWDYPRPDWIAAWVRRGSVQRNGALGGFNNWEPILMYGFRRLANDVFAYPNYPDDDAREHPTPKPLRLIVDILERMTVGIILDPFMGSGTTGVACMQLGRKFIGIEIEPKYFEIAVKRLRAAEIQLALPMDDKDAMVHEGVAA